MNTGEDKKGISREYVVRALAGPVSWTADWHDGMWAGAETLEVACFRPESSQHRPRTLARLLHGAETLEGIFQVRDRYVRCVRTRYFDEVWKDSCVEFFAEPVPGKGYFNFEFNCGGAYLCSFIRDPERVPGGFKDFTRLPPEIGGQIEALGSLPRVVDPEKSEPVTWTLRFRVPLSLIEAYSGELGPLNQQVWRGNFFKCAEEVSHPHWASWLPVDLFNFHRPGCFGRLRFV